MGIHCASADLRAPLAHAPIGKWVFRTNVTGDFGIVTEDFGLS